MWSVLSKCGHFSMCLNFCRMHGLEFKFNKERLETGTLASMIPTDIESRKNNKILGIMS